MKPASLGKECGAFIIDFLMVAILSLFLRLVIGQYVFAPAMGYNEVVAKIQDYAAESGLYIRNGKDVEILSYSEETDAQTYSHYADYADAVWTYYYDVCASSTAHPDFTLTGYEGDVADETAKGKYIYNHFYGIDETIESGDFYRVATDGLGEFDYTSAPVLTDESIAKLDSEDASVALDIRKSLYQYFTDSTRGLYVQATQDFISQPPVAAAISHQSRIVYTVSLPAYALSPLIFFLIIPLFSKKGKTLGKRFLRLSVVSPEGYLAPLPFRAIRGFLLMLPFGLLMIPVSAAWVYLGLVGLYLIDLIVLLLNPKKNSIHGMASLTRVIDDKINPTVFASEAEENEYADSHDDALAKEIKASKGQRTEDAHGGERYINGRRSVLQSDYAEAEILNMDTIGAARREAANISSFDEFEEKKSKQMEENRTVRPSEESEPEPEQPEEPETEEPEVEETPVEEPVQEEKEEDIDPNDDGFLDESKGE